MNSQLTFLMNGILSMMLSGFVSFGQNDIMESTFAGADTLNLNSEISSDLKSAPTGPNVTPYQPTTWDNKIVVSSEKGTHASTPPFWSNQTLYVDWTIVNSGTTAITTTFYTKMYIDDVEKGNWFTSSLASGYTANVLDIDIGKLSVGTHTIRIVTDVTGVIAETNEADNSYTRTITVYPYVNLTPYQPSTWDDKIVLSTVTGTNTSDTQILDTENIYLDWSIMNTGSYATTATFYIDLYIDGTWKTAWSRTGLGKVTSTNQLDYLVGKLPAGSHTFTYKIDIDDHVTEYNEKDNEYSRTITVYNKNVLPYQRNGWDNKLVLSTVTGTNTSASAIFNNQNIYVDWAIWNNGSAAITESFHSKLYVDGVLKNSWVTNGLAANYTALVTDYNIGKLATGWHTAQIVTDCNAEVAESNESDNSYTRTFYIGPSYNFLPYQPGDWDNKIVLSTVTGTHTSAPVIYDTQDIYVDWACLNNANDDFAGTFYTRLYVDGVLKASWSKTGLPHNTYTYFNDQNLGHLPAGTHTFRIVMDADGDVAESDETDNEYTRTFTIVNKNLLPYQPAGWDNIIILSTETGTNTSASSICEGQNIYLDYAILNNGTAAISETFYVRLYIDGVAKATWTHSGLGANTYYTLKDYSVGTLAAGSHTFKITADVLDNVDETSETDNEYTRTFTVSTCKNLTPYKPSTWDNKIVLSTGTGTFTSSSTIYDNQPVYLDWAVINDGANPITESFTVKLFVDGVLKNSWPKTGMNAGVYLYTSDYNLGNLTAGTHTFRIVADADNSVTESNEGDNEYSRSVTVLSTTLASPVATAATGITGNGFTANWNAVTAATGYYLDVSPNETFSSFLAGYNKKNVGNVLTHAVSGLTAGTTYYYRVWAYNTITTSANSGTITLTTVPPAPVATEGTDISATRFNANWKATYGALGYRLDVAKDNAFTTFVTGFHNRDTGNELTFAVTGLTLGTTYYYRLRAYNTAGTGPNSNTIMVKIQVDPPVAPVATAATEITLNGFTANWNGVTAATGYSLDISASSTFASFVTGYKNKDAGNVLTETVTGLDAGTTWYYRVRAYGPGGTSPHSNVIKLVTKLAPVVANEAANISRRGFTARWNSGTGATGYFLDISDSNTFESFVTGFENKDVGNVLTAAVTGLTPCTTYYYRIRPYNPDDTGDHSNVVTVALENNAPTVLNKISDYQISTGTTLNISVSSINGLIFHDLDPGDVLTVAATRLSGAPLPPFITRSGDVLTVSPALADTGCLDIVVKASDVCHAFVTDTFRLCVDLNTGIPLSERLSEFTLYPNPTTGQVRIETGAIYKSIWVTVYNLLGSEIFRKVYYLNEPILFDLSGQTPGIYLIRLNDGTTEISKNLILDRLK